MILGAHESVAGGLHLAFARAARDGAAALQIWTRSSRQWHAPPLERAAVRAFRAADRAYPGGRMPTSAHASYLINLAAPDGAQHARATAALLDECRRAETLGVGQVIVHPGAHLGAGARAGCARVAAALREICRALGPRPRVRLLLECTAGQGSSVGCRFEELAEMLSQAGERRLGVCLDTQHLHAAGIDWTTPRGYARTFEAFDRTVGLRHLEAFHLNDSKRPAGARVDRHERIGAGTIGLGPFRRLMRDARFARLPGYLETPPLPSGEESYADGLAKLRGLAATPRAAVPPRGVR
ncbi:MAG TPA: deoxyribonuclease IV [Myxococcota bacterium]|nr:deoxyribonuclease IV [Myxococcota bacterium]